MSILINRVGQKDNAGDDRALFLTKWSGEVINAFRETNVMMPRHTVRTIESGKTAQFPATWKATAAYHTPGNRLTGGQIPNNERLISIDDLLVSHVYLDQLDQAMNHADYRGEYTFQLGAALAKQADIHLQRTAILAARATATVTGGNGGTGVIDADGLTNADSLAASIYDIAQGFDEKDVPSDQRVVFLKPAQWYLLIESATKTLDTDFNPEGNGSYSSGTIRRIAGIELVKTNNLPQTNVTTGPSAYQGNFSTIVAFGMHRSAIGTVKLMDVASEMGWLIDYQSWLFVSKYAMGHGILRPEAAAEITTS